MPRKTLSDTPRAPMASQDALTAQLLARYEVVPIAALKPHPQNYLTHPDTQQAHLEASLTLHDQYKNVVTAEDLTLLAGHGLVDAARALGKTHMVIVRMPYAPDDDRALQLMAGDNEVPLLAHKHDRELALLLEGLQARGGDEALLSTGLDALMLQGLGGGWRLAPAPVVRDPDEGEEPEDDEETLWKTLTVRLPPGTLERYRRLMERLPGTVDAEKFAALLVRAEARG